MTHPTPTDHPSTVRRYEQALWYAFGIEDATGERIDAFAFAQEAARQARRYYAEEACTLSSVQDQWKRHREATSETYTLDVCVDCVQLIANGEVIDAEGEDIAGEHAERMEQQWPDAHLTLGATDCEHCPDEHGQDCEPWFAWSPCDGCGSTLGGNRSHATATADGRWSR